MRFRVYLIRRADRELRGLPQMSGRGWKRSSALQQAKAGRQVITSNTVRKMHRKAAYVGAKPALRIGPQTRVTRPAKDLAKKLGVAIRVVRIGRRRT